MDQITASLKFKTSSFLSDLEKVHMLLKEVDLGEKVTITTSKFLAAAPALLSTATAAIKAGREAVKVGEEREGTWRIAIREAEDEKGRWEEKNRALERREAALEKREKMMEKKIVEWVKKLKEAGLEKEHEDLKDIGGGEEEDTEDRPAYVVASLPNELKQTIAPALYEKIRNAMRHEGAELVRMPKKCTTKNNDVVKRAMALDKTKPTWRQAQLCAFCKFQAKRCDAQFEVCDRCKTRKEVCFWPLGEDLVLVVKGSSGLQLPLPSSHPPAIPPPSSIFN